ncbi:hypothetical protein BDV93DRAFT_576224 [Ceratobasidium sp. AG-I]|nr:hypothetical protein BDV93DRAFT_576224 [Ceratobasidium sp. AG-I]
MPPPTSPKTKRIHNLERGLRDTREIAFERGERIATLTTETAQLSERVAELEAEVQAAHQAAQLVANERIDTTGRLAGQRITFYGGVMPCAEEVFSNALQAGVTHSVRQGPPPERSDASKEFIRKAVEDAIQWLPEPLRALWTQRSFQISIMKGTRRLTAFTINYVTSHGQDVFGIPDPAFKVANTRKTLPEVQALLENQMFLFGEGVDLKSRHSIICQHGRHTTTRNLLRYILGGGSYVMLGHRNAHAKPSRASMWGVNSINAPAIALALTMVYHVLLGRRTFWNKPGGVDYLEFYERRLERLCQQQDRSPAAFNSLIEWLNNDLFPPALPNGLDADGDIDMNAGENLLMDALDGWEGEEGEGDDDDEDDGDDDEEEEEDGEEGEEGEEGEADEADEGEADEGEGGEEDGEGDENGEVSDQSADDYL